jgi:hypothetical protein
MVKDMKFRRKIMKNKDTLLESAPTNILMSVDEVTDYLWSVTVTEPEGRTTLARFIYFEDAAMFLGEYLIQHENATGGSIDKIKEKW